MLKDEGLLVFTFHHKEGDRWTGLLRSIFDAGFVLVAAYPTHSEALNSIVIQATKGITYDIVHVCRKRTAEVVSIAWPRLRREVQREARRTLAELEHSGDVLPGPDVWMILLGKALRLFSEHYGMVLDEKGEPMDLDEAMERIRVLVREVRGQSMPLPGPLHDTDGLSQVYLLHVLGREGWTRDGLHIELVGYAHGPDDLLGAGLIERVAGANGRLTPVSALDRWRARGPSLLSLADPPLVDKLHALIGAVEDGGEMDQLLRRWRGQRAQLDAAFTYAGKADPAVRDACNLLGRALDRLPEDGPKPQGELGL